MKASRYELDPFKQRRYEKRVKACLIVGFSSTATGMFSVLGLTMAESVQDETAIHITEAVGLGSLVVAVGSIGIRGALALRHRRDIREVKDHVNGALEWIAADNDDLAQTFQKILNEAEPPTIEPLDPER